MKDTKAELRALIEEARRASNAYYNTGDEIMTNHEFDDLVNRISAIEEETGMIYPDSPTQTVGYAVSEGMEEVVHEYEYLSLDKTKDRDAFVRRFFDFVENDKRTGRKGGPVSDEVVLMWKMDGSTVVATYDNGSLTMLATHGNGQIGGNITANAGFIHGLPKTIPYRGHVVVRGEAVMSYEEFNRINAGLPEEMWYKNARNLANSSVSMKEKEKLAERKIDFFAFGLITVNGSLDGIRTVNGSDYDLGLFEKRLGILASLGFSVVEHECVHVSKLEETMKAWDARVQAFGYPVDGLVAAANDAEYADTLPSTSHNPHIMRGFAFKWADEEKETVLRNIEWSASRTGRVNPVAVFDPVDLEGTTVTRASLHNITYVRDMNLAPGDHIVVYKSNKIIPQIDRNLDKDKHAPMNLNDLTCPVCGSKLEFIDPTGSGSVFAVCKNPDCAAKKVGALTHYCERDCANIKGMSEETITKLVNAGFLHEPADFYQLDRYKDKIAAMDGFGERSYANMVMSASKSARLQFIPFVHALGITNIGNGQAKLLYKHLVTEYRKNHDIHENGQEESFFHALVKLVDEDYDFTVIEGIGPVMNASLKAYFTADMVKDVLDGTENTFLGRLLKHVDIIDEWPTESTAGKMPLSGLTFVITGSVHHFKNRDELKAKIEELGGKATGSVTKNTSFLINNDTTSTSGKNKKAKELGIKIISEEEFLEMAGV